MSDPFKIEGPALISFSGGRTSGYMLWRILQAHGGTLPSDVFVTFANTGKEMPATLDFVNTCSVQWSVEIVWLEYDPTVKWRLVNYQTASRYGMPFAELLRKKKMLANPVMRFCTSSLKIIPMQEWAKAKGWNEWTNVIGLRADEPMRVARMRADKDRDNAMPLATAGITKPGVMAFWKTNSFDLELKPGQGNCDLCFLKGAATIQAIMRDVPGVADWWIDQEADRNATFRSDRPRYAEMAKAVREQRTFDFGDRDELIDCFCGDAA